jgi:hypothetical protein
MRRHSEAGPGGCGGPPTARPEKQGRTLNEAGRKSTPEELIVIVLLQGSAGVGSRAERLVCGGAFRLADVPAHRKGGRLFLCRVLSSIRRDREFVRFYVRWR